MEEKKYIRDGRSPIPAKSIISKVMSANKSKNTKPELILRKALWNSGIRGYRLHLKGLPGRPDIALRVRESQFLYTDVSGIIVHIAISHYQNRTPCFGEKSF